MKPDKKSIIQQLGLQPHPEGGYYVETYRSTEKVITNRGERTAGTLIYFLLESENFSAFHRLQSDEAWYFHAGDSAVVYIIHPDGQLEEKRIGPGGSPNEQWQVMIPAHCWFAAEVMQPNAYLLVSCSVSPGFEFSEFELANRAELAQQYPQHTALIERLCRQ
jgi:predicted cupin superfamily sugar epimerase